VRINSSQMASSNVKGQIARSRDLIRWLKKPGGGL
jgi:hypothetical protein